jgi:hypothetical protein
VRFELLLSSSRLSAYPFDAFSRSCPVCGGDYAGHEAASLGGDVAPAERFCSAIQNNDWARVFAGGRDEHPLGDADLLAAFAVRCPDSGRCVVFLVLNRGGLFDRDAVISQQILTDPSAADLMRLPLVWRPVIRDRLREMQAREEEQRRDRRRSRVLAGRLERGFTRAVLEGFDPDVARLLIMLLSRGGSRSASRAAEALRVLGWEVRAERRVRGRRYLVRGPAEGHWMLVDGRTIRRAAEAELRPGGTSEER